MSLDSRLNFIYHASKVCSTINRKLFSIKRLFYLSTSVKIQFFKSFILPYFDHCLSIFVYFSKTAISKIYKCYLFCLFKLFNFSIANFNTIYEFNTYLNDYNLNTFQYRLIKKLCNFVRNVYISKLPELCLTLL